jgi:hypothetical protein
MKHNAGVLWPSLLALVCGLGLLFISPFFGLCLVLPGALGVATFLLGQRERSREYDDDEAEEAARMALLADVMRADAEAEAKKSP